MITVLSCIGSNAPIQPYGQISDITNPVPVPAGNLRYSTIMFASQRGAARAHNCIHGFTLVDEPASEYRYQVHIMFNI
jgi:hypothetical protein